MALVAELMNTINLSIKELALWLEETYEISSEDIINKWQDVVKQSPEKESIPTPVVKSKGKKKTSIPKMKETELCQHIFLKGDQTGERCTVKPKNGGTYCSSHKPKNVKSPKQKPEQEKNAITSDFESDKEDISPVKPVLKKKTSKKAELKKKDDYDTDEEICDDDLELDD
jgi:hypothetical protein